MKIGRLVITASALALGAISPGAASSVLPIGAAPSTETAAIPMVGVLMDADGTHWCTASVVHSPQGNLAVTAAHCVDSATTYFVPGYQAGDRPFGTWQVVAQTSSDTVDVAFLEHDRPVDPVTGAFRLAVGTDFGQEVRLTGYPNDLDQPITCENDTTALDAQDMRIDCNDFSDGTSGSPWVTGDDSLIGVIGGYQDGGYDADISYSPYFDETVAALYAEAIG